MRILTGAVGAAVLALAAGTAAAAAPAHAMRWAPASTAAIHPGMMTFTAGAQCTANFVYTDATGAVYLGQAAHCAGTGSPTDTNGCTSPTLPLGTVVTDQAGNRIGVIAYSSWVSMQRAHESDPGTCAYNDLALVRVDRARVGQVNPSVPFFGGPTGLAPWQGADTGVLSYGNSELRMGLPTLSPKRGLVLDTAAGGWTHDVYTLTPGIPGDSGSGFLTVSGRALGVLSTVSIAPLPGENGVGDLPRELAYANAHGMHRLTLVPGTTPFQPPLLP